MFLLQSEVMNRIYLKFLERLAVAQGPNMDHCPDLGTFTSLP